MSDYISREAVNDTINETAYEYEEDKAQTALYHAADRLNDLPAADVVEVRHGRWREVENGESGHLCECSACKEWMLFYYDFVANYCPNCGAKMDGGQKNAQ